MTDQDWRDYKVTMALTCTLGGIIWLIALWDYLANGNPTAKAPLMGIPLGVLFWSVLWYCTIEFLFSDKDRS